MVYVAGRQFRKLVIKTGLSKKYIDHLNIAITFASKNNDNNDFIEDSLRMYLFILINKTQG